MPPSDFLLQHEGIKALVYDSENGDHSGFDNYLTKVHEHTAPTRIIGRLLKGKRLLWLDPKPDNNLYGIDIIRQSTSMGCDVVECGDPATALRLLSDKSFDLLISHWGHGLSLDESGRSRANAVELLEGIKAFRLELPMIVLASSEPEHVRENRLKALFLVHSNILGLSKVSSQLLRISSRFQSLSARRFRQVLGVSMALGDSRSLAI